MFVYARLIKKIAAPIYTHHKEEKDIQAVVTPAE
jgi:hypothetical protein